VFNAAVKYEQLSAVGPIRDRINQRRLRIATKRKGITDCVSNDVSDDETR